MFPVERPRRLRQSDALRGLVRETRFTPAQLVYPLFVRPGRGEKVPIRSMPGIHQWSVDAVHEEVERLLELGVKAFLLFGIPAQKDAVGSEAYDEAGIVQEALRSLKARHPSALLIADLCLCEYTDHGHCGVLQGETVANDPTLDLLARTALAQVKAGADVVAPSDMMDGRVAAIRRALDGKGYGDVPILSYAAKYASAFYGPFREAAENAPGFGDRKSYQMDPANAREAGREVLLDIEEGADMILVKPAMAYLDILAQTRSLVEVPVGAYQVSGEFSMLQAAIQNGWLDGRRVIEESVTAIFRAGADFVVTYFAPDLARWHREG